VLVAILSVVAFLVLMLLTAFFIALWFTGRILRRQASFWWQAGPILLAYRWSIRKLQLYGTTEEGEEQTVLDNLHEEYAPKALEIVQSMGGMFLKMAQVAANNPMIPIQYRRQFAKCMDRNLPMDLRHVRAEVEAALRKGRPAKLAGRKLEDVFSRFESEPLGVASIGQVHQATVSKTGRAVAIKVKFPDVEQLFLADLASLKVLARIIRASWAVPMIEEFGKQVEQEFNYEQEALNLETITNVLMPKFEGKIEIPSVCRDLTTDNVLTMTFVEGTRLDTALKQRLQAAGMDAARLEKAVMMGGSAGGGGLLARELEEGQASSQSALAPQANGLSRIARLSNRTSGLVLDVLLAALRFKSCMDGCFRGLRRSRRLEGGSEVTEVLAQADVRAALRTMLEMWGYSILEVGTFHADPHPGNVLLQPGGKLGLLDFGQVKTLTAEAQTQFAQLVVAVADNDREAIIQVVRKMGFEVEPEAPSDASSPSPEAPEIELAETIFGGAVPGLQERIRVMRSIRQAPPELFFVIRCSVVLRGVGFGLGQRVHLAKSWRHFAQRRLDGLAGKAGKDAEKASEEEKEPAGEKLPPGEA